MALAMSLQLSSGVEATYHRIITATADFDRNETTLNMQSFLSELSRREGKAPLSACSLTVSGMPSFEGDPRPWAYAQFKAWPEWAGAVDV